MIIKNEDNANIELLNRNHLPIIKDINHLLTIFELTPEQEKLFFYSKTRGNLYKKFQIPKRNGKKRTIEVPCQTLKSIQKAINNVILKRFKMSSSACAYIKNKSIINNALPHLGAKIIWKFDIKDFFNSITIKQIVGQFRYFGYGRNVSRYLAYLCTNEDLVLPQGAPTSPTLSNLICVRLDARIRKFAKNNNLNYTRYADDITLSSIEDKSSKECLSIKKFIIRLIIDEGFMPNEEKCNIYKNGSRLLITGVIVNKKMNAKKEQIREVENAIRYIRKFGIEDHLKKINYFKDIIINDFYIEKYINHIFGLCYFISMINYEKGNKLLNEFKSLNCLRGYND